MMNQGEIEFSKEVLEEYVNVITDVKFMERSSSEGLKPLTIFFEDDPIFVNNVMMHQSRLTVEVPSHFPSMDNKMVPWNYNCNYVHEVARVNISSIGVMTRSERCYGPIMIERPHRSLWKKSLNKKNQRWSQM